MKYQEFGFLVSLVCYLFFLTGCAENLPQDIPKTYSAPEEYTFNVPYDKSWKGVVKAISKENRVKTLDRSSGLIVTDYMTVNKEILTMFQTALFGRTYKNSYSVTLFEEGPGRTNISIQANLLMEQFAFYERERRVTWFEAFMRQELFNDICQTLYKDELRCNDLFPSYKPGSEYDIPEPSDTTTYAPQEDATIKSQTSQSDYPSQQMIFDAQRALASAGYQPGIADGVMGKKTRSALMAFQADQNLYSTGLLDRNTIAALGIGEQ